jgi:hypothetical protein
MLIKNNYVFWDNLLTVNNNKKTPIIISMRGNMEGIADVRCDQKTFLWQ